VLIANFPLIAHLQQLRPGQRSGRLTFAICYKPAITAFNHGMHLRLHSFTAANTGHTGTRSPVL
jgi:hypothetical protein